MQTLFSVQQRLPESVDQTQIKLVKRHKKLNSVLSTSSTSLQLALDNLGTYKQHFAQVRNNLDVADDFDVPQTLAALKDLSKQLKSLGGFATSLTDQVENFMPAATHSIQTIPMQQSSKADKLASLLALDLHLSLIHI